MSKKHLLIDFDGCMGSNQLYYTAEGKTMKAVSTNDSLLISIAKDFPNVFESILVITGDNTGLEITKARLKDIKLDHVYVKNFMKYSWIEENYGLGNVIYIGDDIYDMPILREAYYSATVNNTLVPIKAAAKYVSPFNGGEGAISDIILHILNMYGVDVNNYVDNKVKNM